MHPNSNRYNACRAVVAAAIMTATGCNQARHETFPPRLPGGLILTHSQYEPTAERDPNLILVTLYKDSSGKRFGIAETKTARATARFRNTLSLPRTLRTKDGTDLVEGRVAGTDNHLVALMKPTRGTTRVVITDRRAMAEAKAKAASLFAAALQIPHTWTIIARGEVGTAAASIEGAICEATYQPMADSPRPSFGQRPSGFGGLQITMDPRRMSIDVDKWWYVPRARESRLDGRRTVSTRRDEFEWPATNATAISIAGFDVRGERFRRAAVAISRLVRSKQIACPYEG